MPNKPLLTLHAHAKVNLFLNIGPRRADGYHDLQSVFQEISLADVLTFQSHPTDIRLTVSNLALPTDESNLVVKALLMLKKKLRISAGLHVHLNKKIPMGAGLGGGSSDAAMALLGGYALWKKKPLLWIQQRKDIPPVLFDCAQTLGADVSFFLRGGTAWAEGKGEKLTPLPKASKRWFVLLYPRIHVATPLAYRLLDEARAGKKKATVFAANSFEPVIYGRYPAIRKASMALLKAGVSDVMMSGSGSTVFGVVGSSSEGARILKKFQSYDGDLFLTHSV